jgi:hypothetical protein
MQLGAVSRNNQTIEEYCMDAIRRSMESDLQASKITSKILYWPARMQNEEASLVGRNPVEASFFFRANSWIRVDAF